MMRRLIYTAGLLLTIHTASAQNGWETCSADEFSNAILAMEQAFPENTAYSYETEYLFFEQPEAVTPILTEQAVLVCSDKGELYIEQFGKTIVQDKTVQLEIDPAMKTVVLRDAQQDFTKRKTLSDFSVLNTSGSVIRKKQTGAKTIFSIQFPQGFRYAGAEITTGGAMGIERYVLYSAATTLENEEGKPVAAQPRMEVSFRNFLQGSQVNTGQIKKTAHFLTVNNGIYSANEPYTDYELIDLRSHQ